MLPFSSGTGAFVVATTRVQARRYDQYSSMTA